MPSIPYYEQQTSVGGSLNVRADPDAFGAQVAQAAGNLANSGMEIVRQQRDKQAQSWAGTAASQAMIDMTQTLEDSKASAGPGAPNFTPNVLQKFDAYRDKLVESAPTAQSKTFLAQHMNELRARIGDHAIAFEAQARGLQKIDNAQTTSANLAKVVAQDPSQYTSALGIIDQAVSALPSDVAPKVRAQAVAALSAAAADKLLITDPKSLYDLTGKALNIPEAPPPPATSSAPAPAGAALSDAQAASAAACDDPSRIPILRQEMNDPATTQVSREVLGAEIDRLQKLVPLTPQQPAAVAGPSIPTDDTAPATDGKPKATGQAFLDNASLSQLLQWRQQARAEMERTNGVARTALDAKAKDFQSMVLAGVTPPPDSVPTFTEYAQAFGPQAGQRYASDVDMYLRLQAGLTQLQGASYADRQAVIARSAPTPGAGFDEQQRVQSSIAQANALIEKRIATDPAAYAMQTAPTVQRAWAAVQAHPGDAASIDAFAQATIAEQERLGIRSIKSDVLGEGGAARQLAPRLLTNAQANTIASQFNTTGANAAQLMEALQAQWGSHFPQVFSQLAQDEKIPPAALVIPNMSDPYAKETLARYSDPKLQEEMKKNLPAGSSKDIESKLLELNEPFFNTLSFQQGGQRTYDTVLEQQRVLASAYVMQGRSASDAARLAYEQTVGHQYVFADSLRIPKSAQPLLVQSGLGTLRMNPESLNATPPPSFRPGLTSKDRDAAWLDAIKSNATWVANADESGATMVVRGRTDAGADVRYPVPGPDGKPLTWTWSQLRAIGMDRQAKARAIIENAPPIQDVPMGGGY